MQQLTRKWWKRGRRRSSDDDGGGGDRFSLPTRDDFQPIDTQQQEEMVRDFEKAHGQQSRLWRSVFGGFLIGYVAFLMYSIFQQAWSPWELRYHAYFMDEIHPWMVIFADWIAVFACLLAVKGLLQSSRSYRQWMWYSSYAGLLLAGFWLYYMMRSPKFHWDIIWLPFGPLSGAGVCLYVDHLLEESLEDIRKLRNYTFNLSRGCPTSSLESYDCSFFEWECEWSSLFYAIRSEHFLVALQPQCPYHWWSSLRCRAMQLLMASTKWEKRRYVHHSTKFRVWRRVLFLMSPAMNFSGCYLP